MGWIGVDLDGTLAVYEHWNNGQVGEPVPLMLERVKRWIAEGKEVRIITARVGLCKSYSPESKRYGDQQFADEQIKIIDAWCEKHIGVRLPITASKDFEMVEMWDDRCIRVKPNTGEVVGG